MISFLVLLLRKKDQILKNKKKDLFLKVQPIRNNSLKYNNKFLKFSLQIKISLWMSKLSTFWLLLNRKPQKSNRNRTSLLLLRKILMLLVRSTNLSANKLLVCSLRFQILATSTLCISILWPITSNSSLCRLSNLINHLIWLSVWRTSKITSFIHSIPTFVDHYLKKINFYYPSYFVLVWHNSKKKLQMMDFVSYWLVVLLWVIICLKSLRKVIGFHRKVGDKYTDLVKCKDLTKF
jgi:hypothetical protein